MSAPKDNNYAMKWKTKKERVSACNAVRKHLESGLSQDCFIDADWDTVERYIKDFPEDFPTEKIAASKRKGRKFWEILGIKGATGVQANFNAASWIFTMKNKYGWRDKVDIDHGGKVEVVRIIDDIPKDAK